MKIVLLKRDSVVPDYTRESLRRAKAPDYKKRKRTLLSEGRVRFQSGYWTSELPEVVHRCCGGLSGEGRENLASMLITLHISRRSRQ